MGRDVSFEKLQPGCEACSLEDSDHYRACAAGTCARGPAGLRSEEREDGEDGEDEEREKRRIARAEQAREHGARARAQESARERERAVRVTVESLKVAAERWRADGGGLGGSGSDTGDQVCVRCMHHVFSQSDDARRNPTQGGRACVQLAPRVRVLVVQFQSDAIPLATDTDTAALSKRGREAEFPPFAHRISTNGLGAREVLTRLLGVTGHGKFERGRDGAWVCGTPWKLDVPGCVWHGKFVSPRAFEALQCEAPNPKLASCTHPTPHRTASFTSDPTALKQLECT